MRSSWSSRVSWIALCSLSAFFLKSDRLFSPSDSFVSVPESFHTQLDTVPRKPTKAIIPTTISQLTLLYLLQILSYAPTTEHRGFFVLYYLCPIALCTKDYDFLILGYLSYLVTSG